MHTGASFIIKFVGCHSLPKRTHTNHPIIKYIYIYIIILACNTFIKTPKKKKTLNVHFGKVRLKSRFSYSLMAPHVAIRCNCRWVFGSHLSEVQCTLIFNYCSEYDNITNVMSLMKTSTSQIEHFPIKTSGTCRYIHFFYHSLGV